MISNISSNYQSICGLFNFSKVGFLSFEECRKEVRKCKFKNVLEYKKNRKQNWPLNPYKVYKNKGWKGWHDFLGKEKISFLSFEECRKEVRKCKFKKILEYQKNRKQNWPSCPHETYKEWQGWNDFLGKVGRYDVFLSFEECRKEVRKCRFKNMLEYQKNRKKNWPSKAHETYKNKGWKDGHDFLGKVGFLSFEECRKEVRKCKFKNVLEYKKNRKQNWPSDPDNFYKNKGWKDYFDFLGK
jgi:hypothetical protein